MSIQANGFQPLITVSNGHDASALGTAVALVNANPRLLSQTHVPRLTKTRVVGAYQRGCCSSKKNNSRTNTTLDDSHLFRPPVRACMYSIGWVTRKSNGGKRSGWTEVGSHSSRAVSPWAETVASGLILGMCEKLATSHDRGMSAKNQQFRWRRWVSEAGTGPMLGHWSSPVTGPVMGHLAGEFWLKNETAEGSE